MKRLLLLWAISLLGAPYQVFAAIGCTLTNPAQDLKYLYPEMTTYKEDLYAFAQMKGGAESFRAFRERMRGELDPIYETYETAYTVYSIFKGPEKIGIVHGVNVPGKGGVIQVFLSMDPKTAEIRSFLFQRLESPAARQLRSKEFRGQFEGLTLGDFYKHDYYAAVDPGAKADKVGAIKPPTLDASGRPDYEASLRGLRKNLILLDFFLYGRRFDPYFERAKQATEKAKSRKE